MSIGILKGESIRIDVTVTGGRVLRGPIRKPKKQQQNDALGSADDTHWRSDQSEWLRELINSYFTFEFPGVSLSCLNLEIQIT